MPQQQSNTFTNGSLSLAAYLAELNPQQLAAVRHSGSNLLVHAGAGSGKTRVVIARILHHIWQQGIAPYQILAVTFTNRAAREMRDRLSAHLDAAQSERVLIRTFHSFGAWFLRRYAAQMAELAREFAYLTPNFSIYDEQDSEALLKQSYPACVKKAKLLQRLIGKAKDAGYYRAASADQLVDFSREPDFPKAFELYSQALERSGNVDFADLLALPVRALEQCAPVREHLQRRFCRILVDEYQDSNPLQNRLLHLLLDARGTRPKNSGATTEEPPGAPELCIVGDEDQSIYSFRGAQIQHILEFEQNFAPAARFKLEQNYRSRATILDLANAVIGHNRKRLGKTLRSTKSGGPLPQFQWFSNCEEEAAFAAARIGAEPRQSTAILYRTNAQSLAFERALRQYNIPYRLVGSLSFYRREEIKDIVAFLKCLANPRDLVSFARIYNKPARGLGPRILHAVQEQMEQHTGLGVSQAMRQILQTQALKGLKPLAQLEQMYSELAEWLDGEDAPPLWEFIGQVLQRSGLLEYFRQRDAQEQQDQRCLNFDSLLYEARRYQKGRAALVAFLQSIELESEAPPAVPSQVSPAGPAESAVPAAPAQCVNLITMHNTKGLEFERVFITGLELGIFPNQDSLNCPHKLEEERRLFYVAVTRAEEQLYLSAAEQRMLYGKNQYRELSPLLCEVDPHLYQNCSNRPAAAQKRDLSACKIVSHATLQQMRWPQVYPPKAAKPKGPAPQRPSDPFTVGARVEHLEYGLGYVVRRKHSGAITTLMIQLDDGRLVRLQLEFARAKLEFLGTGL